MTAIDAIPQTNMAAPAAHASGDSASPTRPTLSATAPTVRAPSVETFARSRGNRTVADTTDPTPMQPISVP